MLHAKKLHGPLHFVTIIAGVWHRIATTLHPLPTSTAFRNSRPAIFTKNFLHESQLCSLRLYVFLLLSRLPTLISVLYNFPPAVNWILQQLAFLSPARDTMPIVHPAETFLIWLSIPKKWTRENGTNWGLSNLGKNPRKWIGNHRSQGKSFPQHFPQHLILRIFQTIN